MHVHGKSMAHPSLNALLAQARQSKAQIALGNSTIEAKPGVGLGRGLGHVKHAGDAAPPSHAAAQQPGTDATLEGIRKHWGQSDSPYDLNGDGTVNIDDILHYINGQAAGSPDQPAGDDASAAAITADDVEIQSAPPAGDTTIPAELSDTQQPLNVEGFHEHWGQSNAQYDLNGDGTVNMDDLLTFINSQPPPQTPDASIEDCTGPMADCKDSCATPSITAGSNDATGATDVVAVDDPIDSSGQTDGSDSQPQVTLDGLLAAWGSSNATFDLNSDGTVNIDDLLQFISQLGPPGSQPGNSSGGGSQLAASEIPAQVSATEVPAKSQRGEQLQARLQNLTDTLINRLNESGFEDHPPTNIRDLVSRLNLGPSQMNFIMHKLSQRYPLGLGVNMEA